MSARGIMYNFCSDICENSRKQTLIMKNGQSSRIQEITISMGIHSGINIDYSDEDIMLFADFEETDFKNAIRLDLHMFAICSYGSASLSLNSREYAVKKHDVIYVPPQTILDHTHKSRDFKCSVLCLSNNIFQNFISSNIRRFNTMAYIKGDRVKHLDNEEFDIFTQYYQLITSRMRKKKSPTYKLVMQAIIQAMIIDFCGAWYDDIRIEEGEDGTIGASSIIFNRFLSILAEDSSQKHTVKYYADKLCITPKYLSAICKDISGKAAYRWVQDSINEQILYHIKSQDMSIKEISDCLGFSNISFFGKYVKKNFGLSPRALRNKIAEQ